MTAGSAPSRQLSGTDPLVRALARYVEALERRYPDGPAQLHRERLDARAKVVRMPGTRHDPVP